MRMSFLTLLKRSASFASLCLLALGALLVSACGAPSSSSNSTPPPQATATITPHGGGSTGPTNPPTPTPVPSNPTATPNNPAPTPTIVPPPPTTPHPNFVQTANSSNSLGDFTIISSTLTNNNPNALLFVTPNWNPGNGGSDVYDNSPIGVYYFIDAGTGYWAIFNQDLNAIPNGASFNVQVLNPSASVFVQTAGSGNISGDNTVINNSALNGNPNALLMVTPNWNPGGSGDVYDNHPIGVYYNGSAWAIYNQDTAPMPSGASFNVRVLSSGTATFVQTANSSNIVGDNTTIANPLSNNNPNAIVLVTPNWNPGDDGADVYDNHNIGVYYNGSGWAIFNQDGATMPTNAAFNVEVLSGS